MSNPLKHDIQWCIGFTLATAVVLAYCSAAGFPKDAVTVLRAFGSATSAMILITCVKALLNEPDQPGDG